MSDNNYFKTPVRQQQWEAALQQEQQQQQHTQTVCGLTISTHTSVLTALKMWQFASHVL